MGSPPIEPVRYDNENQVMAILTKGFWLGQHEVTQSEWRHVMRSMPWSGKQNIQEGDNYPATYVSWPDATSFCKKLTDAEHEAGRLAPRWAYTLPTEAQWEDACRAGKTSIFSFGDDPSVLSRYAWWGGLVGHGSATNERLRPFGGPERRRTNGVCMTCTATSGNGARTGTRTAYPRDPTRRGRKRVPIGCTAAEAGATPRDIVERPAAAATSLRVGSTIWASAWQLLNNRSFPVVRFTSRGPVGQIVPAAHRRQRLPIKNRQAQPALRHSCLLLPESFVSFVSFVASKHLELISLRLSTDPPRD